MSEPVKRATAWTISGCRPLRGLPARFYLDPGVALAKPRSTPGFTLSLASRALLSTPGFTLALVRELCSPPRLYAGARSRALLRTQSQNLYECYSLLAAPGS